MNKLTDTYRHLSVWILAAVFVNLLFPSAMEAAQLFCKNGSFAHSTEMHTASTCWMDIGSDATQTDLGHDGCSLDQICEQSIKTVLSETPVIQHQNIQVMGIPLTGSTFYTFPTKSGQAAPVLPPENTLQVLEIYLLNSTFLN